MKKTLLLILAIFLLTGCGGEDKPKSVTCTAGEEVGEGLSTKVITKYHYNKSGLLVTGIDYTIEITSENDYSQLTTSKSFYENTICNTANLPANITCKMELTETQLKVITHENVENNQSVLLKIGDLSKFTYDSFKDRKEDGIECKLN
ncbi:MAG: hypothetical protein ACI4OP_04655 [Candidatus Coprovivens sp.]